MSERLLTLAEAAERFRFTERRLRGLVKRHAIRVLRDGRDIRFDDIALRALEEALRQPCAPAPSASSGGKTAAAPSRRGGIAGDGAAQRHRADPGCDAARTPARLVRPPGV